MTNMVFALSLVQILFLLTTINCYQMQIPNYELLRNQHILTGDFKFIHRAVSLKQISQSLNEKGLQEGFQPKIHFEMFLYPYRVFSYFDQSNKKQYLFKKIAYQQFNHDEVQNKQQMSVKSQPILYSEFDVRDCLFQKSFPQQEQGQYKQNQQKNCLKQSHIYSLIPQLITIIQQQHEQIQLQKVNEEYFLIKNFANPNSQKQADYYLTIDLHKVNIHSFLYQARLTLMNFLFNEKSNELKNLSNTIQNEKKPMNEEKTITEGKTKDEENNKNTYQIKMKDYFNSMFQVWDLLSQKNPAIFRNLFNFQTSMDIDKSQKYDYTSSKNTFYLTQVNQTQCPISSNNKKFDLFAGSQTQINTAQIQVKDSLCSHMKFYKIPFIQFQVQDATEYFNKQESVSQIKRVSLGATQNNRNSKTTRFYNIMINLMTENENIEISRFKSWKQYGYSQRPQSQQVQQSSASNVFYLQNAKVEIQNTQLVIYKFIDHNLGIYNKHCQLKFQPYLITSQKINNQIFVVCLQGSNCKIIDNQCKTLQEILLQNAFGVEWTYKVNYFEDKVLSFISIFKRSDNLQKVIDAPIDQTLIQPPYLKTQQFLQRSDFIRIQPSLYKGNLSIVNPSIRFKKMPENFEILPSFQLTNRSYRFNPPKLFQDKIYKSFYNFKQRFLDQILQLQLEQKFVKYYVPNFKDQNETQPVKMFNMRNHTEFQQFFNDCVYDEEKRTVLFKQGWNGCKIIMKTNALMLADPLQTKKLDNISQNKTKNKQTQKIEQNQQEKKNQKQKQVQLELNQKQFFQILTKSNLEPSKNKMIVCSAHKSSPAFSKCRVSEYEVTQSFQEGKRKAKFFFEGSRYFQIYFFNQKFSTEEGNKSFIQLLQNLADKTFASQTEQKKQKVPGKGSQLKQFKIVYSQAAVEKKRHFDINLIDYEKQQLENLSKILLISLCILFPIFIICCCVVCFKSYFQNILVYYGVMRVQPSFSYPLNKLALKIRMKQFRKDGYLTIHKNKREHLKQDGLSSNADIKFSAQCCFCLQELKKNEEVVELYCRHEFHSICFIEWVRNQPNTKCPLCKRTFTRSSLRQFNSGDSLSASTRSVTTDNRFGQNFNEQQQQEQISYQVEMIQFQS